MTDQQPEVTPLLDAQGNPNFVAPGEIIESAWGNAIVSRTMVRASDKAALDGVGVSNGQFGFASDNNVMYLRHNGAWTPTTLGAHPGFRVVGGPPGQTIAPNTQTVCTFATETSDVWGCLTGGVFHLPAGWEGRWQFEWGTQINGGEASGSFSSWLSLGVGGRLGLQTAGATEGFIDQSGSASVGLVAGATVGIVMLHSAAVAMPVNTTADQYFQGYFMGAT